jgi:hypothetical protein
MTKRSNSPKRSLGPFQWAAGAAEWWYLSQALPEPFVPLRVPSPDMLPNRRALIVLLLLAAAACHPDFQIAKFPTNEALYRAGQAEFAVAHWDNAIAVFDKLTTDLPARDTLLPGARARRAGRTHPRRYELLAVGRKLPGRLAGRRRSPRVGACLLEDVA